MTLPVSYFNLRFTVFTNHCSFQELLNCGTHCHPRLSLNPTICHNLNLILTNLILSPFLLKLSPFSQFFFCRGFVLGPTAFPRNYLLKKIDVEYAQLDVGVEK